VALVGMSKVIGAFLALFALSVAGMCVGYFNLSLGLARTPLALQWVYEEIPILSTSFLLLAVFVADMALAFFLSRGNYTVFYSEFVGLSIAIPLVVLFALLPSAIETPDHLGSNYRTMCVIVCASQLAVGRYLAKEFWRFGGRRVDGRMELAAADAATYPNKDVLIVLEHLAYVLECLASDLTGEAKTELSRLIERVEQLRIPQREVILGGLRESVEVLRKAGSRRASVPLGRVSRSLWNDITKNRITSSWSGR